MRSVPASLPVLPDIRLLCALSLLLLTPPSATAEFSVVARDGDPIPTLSGAVVALLHLRDTGATEVLREGDPVVRGDELALLADVFGQRQHTINEQGNIAFSISLEDTVAGTTNGAAMLLYDPSDGSQRRIVTRGQSFPSGGSTFEPYGNGSVFDPPLLNAVGQAVFRPTDGIFLDDQGVLREIALQVEASSEDGFTDLSQAWINASGHVAFRAKVRESGSTSEALVPGLQTAALIVFDGITTHTIAHTGGAAPGGGTWMHEYALRGTFGWRQQMVTNDEGQVLFIAEESMSDGTPVKGAYLYDPPPLSAVTRILAVGDSLGSYEVTEINENSFDRGYHGAGALNDAGQSVLNVDLGGSAAIVRYDPGATAALPVVPSLRLAQNVPNPFNPRTELSFFLRAGGHARLEIFDLSGRRVRTLVDGVRSAGEHEVVWRGRDERGEAVASGVYLYRIEAGGVSKTKRMVLVR